MSVLSGISDTALGESHVEKQAVEWWFSNSSTLWAPAGHVKTGAQPSRSLRRRGS